MKFQKFWQICLLIQLRINEGKARNFLLRKKYALLRRKNKIPLITFPRFLRCGHSLFCYKKFLKMPFLPCENTVPLSRNTLFLIFALNVPVPNNRIFEKITWVIFPDSFFLSGNWFFLIKDHTHLSRDRENKWKVCRHLSGDSFFLIKECRHLSSDRENKWKVCKHLSRDSFFLIKECTHLSSDCENKWKVCRHLSRVFVFWVYSANWVKIINWYKT